MKDMVTRISEAMRGWLKRQENSRDADPFPPLAPEISFFAIGDVHGRLDLLDLILDKLDFTKPVVFVGDYVDRGENSAGVLRRLEALTHDTKVQVYCLMGNHEDMLLKFLDNPEKRGKSWLRNGGLQTLASFGVTGISDASPGNVRVAAAQSLRTAMGEALIEWVRNRPLFWHSGNVAVVHAGADPLETLEDQPAQNLIWGHSAFRTTQRRDGMWVMHGHTIVDTPVVSNGVISIDTGAYATGRLTMALVGQGTVDFTTV